MAERNLNIIINAVDNASRELSGIGGALERNRATIQKTTLAATAAFASVTALAGTAVKAAADAEVAWAKFDVVFGDSSEDMRDFVRQIRSDIPLASRQIAKMTAGLGDMLVPMGFARDEAAEMSKEFVATAAGVAAFNNVDPSEVLNAISSGLAGNSMALRRFGVEVSKTRLENIILRDGLVESKDALRDMDVMTRRNIEAQALLTAFTEDSSDAVAGLAKEKETLAFKMAQASAQMQDMRERVGNALIPVVLRLVEAVQPVLDRLAVWIEENPKLIKTIIVGTVALTGLVAVLGMVTLALMALNPVSVIIVGAITAIGLAVYSINNLLKQFGLTWSNVWNGIKQVTASITNFIIDRVENMINRYVDMINIFIRSVNRIADAVSGIPGMGRLGNINISEVQRVEFARAGQGTSGGDTFVNVYGDVSGEELIGKVENSVMNRLGHNIRLSPQ